MMKKSHRKDVIIARIIFVIFCLIVIAVIVGAILLIKRHFPSGGEKNTQTETSTDATEQQGNTFPVIDSQPDSMSVEESQPTETEDIVKVSMKTTTGVNLRKEPNTSCDVLTVLTEGTRVEMIGEEAGWAMVEYQGQTGYVSLDYLEEVTENAGE